MSILIKGMEMPENCIDCGVYWDGCPVWKLENIDKDYSDKRAPNCPLVPVPPHGDLIERDEILKDKVSNAYISRFEIDNAPTIIEADDKDINVPAKEEGE